MTSIKGQNRGSTNPNAKLTEELVREIYKLVHDDACPKMLAQAFGVRSNTIYSIKNHVTWRHLWGLPCLPGRKPK